VRRAGQPISLQPREFKLLEVLMRNPRPHDDANDVARTGVGFRFDPKTSIVETHVSRLRAKVDRPFEAPLIHTERGMGYILEAPPDMGGVPRR